MAMRTQACSDSRGPRPCTAAGEPGFPLPLLREKVEPQFNPVTTPPPPPAGPQLPCRKAGGCDFHVRRRSVTQEPFTQDLAITILSGPSPPAASPEPLARSDRSRHEGHTRTRSTPAQAALQAPRETPSPTVHVGRCAVALGTERHHNGPLFPEKRSADGKPLK